VRMPSLVRWRHAPLSTSRGGCISKPLKSPLVQGGRLLSLWWEANPNSGCPTLRRCTVSKTSLRAPLLASLAVPLARGKKEVAKTDLRFYWGSLEAWRDTNCQPPLFFAHTCVTRRLATPVCFVLMVALWLVMTTSPYCRTVVSRKSIDS